MAAIADGAVLRWSATTPFELLRNLAAQPTDMLVIETSVLGPKLWNVVHEVHSIAPETAALFVGEPDDLPCLSRALGWGLRGVVPSARAATDLARALASLAAGQMWFSRPLASGLLACYAEAQSRPDTDSIDDETSRQLPALTERELAVMHEALQGRTNKEIARNLAISEQTVKIHMQNIFHKLRIHRRIDLMLLHGSPSPQRR